ncbi:MAG: hypothetical protein WBW33_02890, partial [Bryobacteraceae bacterium]
MMKTDADRGQAPVSQGAHKIRISSSMLVAAWTQRACPQIINTCFQSNRARQETLPVDYFKPAFFHKASTRVTTSGDISMTLGQRRVKPSDF